MPVCIPASTERHRASTLSRQESSDELVCDADEESVSSSHTEEHAFADIIADAVAGTRRQQEVWLFLNSVQTQTGIRRWAPQYELFSVGLVCVLLVEDVILSVKWIGDAVDSWPITQWFEYASYFVFTSEYLARVWSCMASAAINDGTWKAAVYGRLKFGVSGLLLVDFVVLAAFYLQLYVDVFYSAEDGTQLQGLQVLRMFRAFRAFRSAKMLKVDRKTNAFGVLLKVLSTELKPIMATLVLAFMMVIVLATLMYYMENTAQPEAFASIPAAMWWAVSALTSVGYGDVYPVTIPGKILGCFSCVVGAGIIALPTGILSNGFGAEIAVAEQEAEAQKIEQTIKDETKRFDDLQSEIANLRSSLESVDLSQQDLLRALRRKFPEKAAQILGPEEEVLTSTFAKPASDCLPLHPVTEEGVRSSDIMSLRDKVESEIARLKMRSKVHKETRRFIVRPGMAFTLPTS